MNTISSWLVRFKSYKNAFVLRNEHICCIPVHDTKQTTMKMWYAEQNAFRYGKPQCHKIELLDPPGFMKKHTMPRLNCLLTKVHFSIDFCTSIRNERWLSCTVLPFTVHRTSTHAKWWIYLSLFLIESYYSFTSMKILKANVFLWSYILLSALLILNCHYAHINTPDTSGYLRF